MKKRNVIVGPENKISLFTTFYINSKWQITFWNPGYDRGFCLEKRISGKEYKSFWFVLGKFTPSYKFLPKFTHFQFAFISISMAY